MEELITALDSFQKEGIRVVVLRAARDARVWSSGHDITELPQGQDPLPYSDSFEQALRAIKTFPTPIIAMVHGSVWGVATDLVLSCDIAIGDETSSFAVTPANIGLAYNTSGLLRFMRRLPLNRVKEMFFIAEPVTAAEAVEWGILNHLVEADRLEDYSIRKYCPMMTLPIVRTARRAGQTAVASIPRQVLSGLLAPVRMFAACASHEDHEACENGIGI